MRAAETAVAWEAFRGTIPRTARSGWGGIYRSLGDALPARTGHPSHRIMGRRTFSHPALGERLAALGPEEDAPPAGRRTRPAASVIGRRRNRSAVAEAAAPGPARPGHCRPDTEGAAAGTGAGGADGARRNPVSVLPHRPRSRVTRPRAPGVPRRGSGAVVCGTGGAPRSVPPVRSAPAQRGLGRLPELP